MLDTINSVVSGLLPFCYLPKDAEPFVLAKSVVLSGSFNPLHHGHEELLRAAEKATGRTGVLELSVSNMDKGTLEIDEIEHRVSSLAGQRPIVITRAPSFIEKAELISGVWFVQGFDTTIRLLSEKYHADVPAMLTRFRELGTKFIVGGRLHEDSFKTLEELHIPPGFENLFVAIPGDDFRADISSTELRNN